MLRIMLAVVCVFCEFYFYRWVGTLELGRWVGTDWYMNVSQ